jgi:hypothetical protein
MRIIDVPNFKDIPRELPHHGVTEVDSKPFKYTAKTRSTGFPVVIASSTFNNVKSRFMYRRESETGSIDFRNKNLRVWFLPSGFMVLKPIRAKELFDPSKLTGFVKLALLQVVSYIDSLKKFSKSYT